MGYFEINGNGFEVSKYPSFCCAVYKYYIQCRHTYPIHPAFDFIDNFYFQKHQSRLIMHGWNACDRKYDTKWQLFTVHWNVRGGGADGPQY